MTTGMFSCGGYVEIRDFDLELRICFTNSRQDTRHLPAHALKKKKRSKAILIVNKIRFRVLEQLVLWIEADKG